MQEGLRAGGAPVGEFPADGSGSGLLVAEIRAMGEEAPYGGGSTTWPRDANGRRGTRVDA
ncbi:hypothetical protein GCM10020219_029640 [Nonomuraea dietziae]